MSKKPVLILIFMCFLGIESVFAGDPIVISKNFTLFTSNNLKGYLQPLFTSVEQSMNSNLYTNACYPQKFTIALDLSAMGMFIPSSQKNYNADRPDKFGNTAIVKTAEMRNGKILNDYTGANTQPTIYGGISTPIFAVPQTNKYPDSTYKTATYVEGNNIAFMSGVPVLQLILGIPTRTEMRFRFWGAPMQGAGIWYYGIIVNQQFDHFFDIFKKEQNMALAANLSYHNLSRDPGLTLNSWSLGVHFSKLWDFGKTGKINAYAGLQYEDLSGSFEAEKDTTGMSSDIIDSPYFEVREPLNYARQKGWFYSNGSPKPMIKFNFSTETKWRLMAGINYRYSFVEFHADAAYCSQPVLSCGFTFWLASFGGVKDPDLYKIEKLN